MTARRRRSRDSKKRDEKPRVAGKVRTGSGGPAGKRPEPIVWVPGAGIAAALQRLRSRPSFANAAIAIAALVRGRRVLETLYGLYCFARHRAMPLHPRTAKSKSLDLKRLARERHVDGWFTTAELHSIAAYRDFAPFLPADAGFRPPALLAGADHLIAGEYGETAGLHFVRRDGFTQKIDLYARDPRVRHIHVVHALGDSHAVVATGDSAKYLDLWRIGEEGLRFERRLMRRLGGFTACATVGGELWLGSDFAGRPNYLQRLGDRRKFFFPRRFRTQYAADLIPLDDRYIIIATSNLASLGLERNFFLFDCVTEQYHED